jgi:RNA polymerase sigma factor (sigma-70 family)
MNLIQKVRFLYSPFLLPFFYIKRIISERALEEDVMKIDTEQVIATYKDRIFAIGLTMLKNPDDAEDVVQETFLRYHTYKKDFESKEHIESWLYKVAINKAKDIQRKFWRRKQVSMEDYMATIPFDRSQDEELFQAVMALPSKYSIVIHLYYYEDYSIKEIAQQLKLNEGNVKVRLSRARQLLKKQLKENWNDEE